MKVQPVTRPRKPRYPDRPTVDLDPEVMRQVPKRWSRNPAVLSALSGLMLMAGGAKAVAHGPKGVPAPKSTLVAPLFVHGEGMGSFGCKAVNPPVILSEADARELIMIEAKRAGIQFKKTDKALPGVSMKAWKSGKAQPDEKVRYDGFDPKHNVGFVFVSVEDVERWQAPPMSTVSHYDAKAFSASLREKMLKAKVKGAVGVFYEPFGERMRSEKKGGDRDELRKQVRDFVKWLKSQGVI